MRQLIPIRIPRNSSEIFKAVTEITKRGWLEIPDEPAFKGSGGPGDFLESLLGIKKNNRDSADSQGWEVKFHGGGTLITLFHKEPQPRGIVRSLVHEHGWEDDLKRISFRHTITGRSDRGFYVKDELDRIIVRHNSSDSAVPYWMHNTLINCASKLQRLILVDAELKRNPRSVLYHTATAFWDLKITSFCDAVEKGIVRVEFDARTKEGAGTALRNHGTKFRVSREDLKLLYGSTKKLTPPFEGL